MRQLRHGQMSLCDGFWASEVEDLWPQWLRVADKILEDEEILELVYEAQGNRHKQSRTRGRSQTPAEVVVRMLVLKHAHNWSYLETTNQVRANIVFREFARVGMEKVPDDKTLLRIANHLGPDVVKGIHERIVEIAQEKKVVKGRRLRVDTTVVETNVHYPTDSSLLGDGARVMTRLMYDVKEQAEGLLGGVRNRMRSVSKQVIAIAIGAKRKGPAGEEQRKKGYRKLIRTTRQVINQAGKVAAQVEKLPEATQQVVAPAMEKLTTMVGRTKQVIRQAVKRIFQGDTKSGEKLASVFEPHTEIIRKGKASKPTEFGKMVKIQEAEHQVVVDYETYDRRPSDSDLLVEAVEKHEELLGCVPQLVAADSAFYSSANEKALEEKGVDKIAVPNRNTKSKERRKKQKEPWFKEGQRWRAGCEGRISVLKRRHGLNRSRYRGSAGIKMWVGLGVIANNLISIGNFVGAQKSNA